METESNKEQSLKLKIKTNSNSLIRKTKKELVDIILRKDEKDREQIKIIKENQQDIENLISLNKKQQDTINSINAAFKKSDEQFIKLNDIAKKAQEDMQNYRSKCSILDTKLLNIEHKYKSTRKDLNIAYIITLCFAILSLVVYLLK